MIVMFFGLAFSLIVMLGFTAIFYRLSPYNGSLSTGYHFPRWEQLFFGFMLAYPVCSLLILLAPGHAWHTATGNVPLFRITYMVFSIAHVFLAVMAAIASYSLRRQHKKYLVLFILNLIAGTLYTTAIFGALWAHYIE